MFKLNNEDADWVLFENLKEIRTQTYLDAGTTDTELQVTVETGSLGAGGGAVSVTGGGVTIDKASHTVADATVDIARGDADPRRDVVYVTATGDIDVAQGDAHALTWGEGVSTTQQTIANSFLPAPRAFDDLVGLPLAVIFVPGNRATALLDDPGTIQPIRLFERSAFDLDEAFKNEEFGYRRLSSFSTLQDAVDWSHTFPGVVAVDGKFRTNETGILIDDQTTFVGERVSDLKAPTGYPAIISTSTSGSDPFFQYSGTNCVVNFNGVNFYNEGNPRAFFVPASGFSGFISFNSSWNNVTIDQFGGTNGHPYTVEIVNGWGITWRNVGVRNRRTTAYGAWRLKNCNAAVLQGLTIIDSVATDGETPGIYVEDCHGLHLDSMHLEDVGTDAILQITGDGDVVATNHYIEGDPDVGANCAIQIGDGGKSQGNVAGGTQGGRVTLIEGVTGALGSGGENIRILNGDATKIIGGSRRDNATLNYGGSNHDSQASLTTAPGPVKIIGNVDIEVSNATNSPASVSIDNGRTFESESAASTGLNAYEWGWVDDASGWGIVRKPASGGLSVWRPGGGGGATTAIRAYLSADQTLPSTTLSNIELDTTSYATAGLDVGAKGQVVIQNSGLYVCKVSCEVLADSGADIETVVAVNDTKMADAIETGVSPDAETTVDLAAGDIVQFKAWQSGSSSATITGGLDTTFGEVRRVGSV